MLTLVLRNIQRRPFHTALTVFLVAVAVMALFSAFWMGRGLEQGLVVGMERLGADVVVLPDRVGVRLEQTLFTGAPMNIYMDEEVYEIVKGLPGVSLATPQFFSQTLDTGCCSVATASRLVGFDPETDFVLRPWLEQVLGRTLGEDELVVGGRVGVEVGHPVLVWDHVFTVAGRLALTGAGLDDTIFVPLPTARRVAAQNPYLESLWRETGPEGLISAVLLRVDDPARAAEVAASIEGLPGVRAVLASEVLLETRRRMAVITTLLYSLTGVLWVVSVVSLWGRFASLVVERKTELGVLRALGATRGDVFRLVLLESGCLALSGGLAGLVVGWFVSRMAVAWLRAGTTFPFLALPPLEVGALWLWCLGAAVLTGLLSALVPAFSSARLDPARAIAQGELE